MRLDPAQILMVAAEVLDRPVEAVVSSCDLAALQRAAASQQPHPARGCSPPALAALLTALVREHPFAEGNDAIAVAAIGLAASLDDQVLDLDEIPSILDQLHANTISEQDIAAWLAARTYRQPAEGAMFERFTPRARQAMAEGQAEARELGHNYIGTEHILLGVARITKGIGARVLTEMDVSVDALRESVKELAPSGFPPPLGGQPPFTPRAKQLLEQALRAAVELGHNYIGTEHLLLAAFRVKAVAREVLERQGLSESGVRERVLRLLSAEVAGAARSRTRAQVLEPINAVLDENDRMRAEIERLRTLLRRHGIDPDAGTASA